VPMYEYECSKCRHRFEKIENVSAAMTRKCPKCGAKAGRIASAAAIQFKGSGWYVNDYSTKSGSADAADKAVSSSDGKSSGDTTAPKPAEKKAETAPEQKASKSARKK
jgi:putative FmdB family regulatory protein